MNTQFAGSIIGLDFRSSREVPAVCPLTNHGSNLGGRDKNNILGLCVERLRKGVRGHDTDVRVRICNFPEVYVEKVACPGEMWMVHHLPLTRCWGEGPAMGLKCGKR